MLNSIIIINITKTIMKIVMIDFLINRDYIKSKNRIKIEVL